jgi:hypothetical protein
MRIFFEIFLQFFNIKMGEAHIGVMPSSSAKSHIIAHVRSVTGGLTQRFFTVDNPDLLKNPTMYCINSMFGQINKLGFIPVHVELLVHDRVAVYRVGEIHPIFSQKLKPATELVY